MTETESSLHSMVGILDHLFPPHEDSPLFEEGNEILDREKNPLSKEDRLKEYVKSVEHFHILGRNYTAFWKNIPGVQIDNSRLASSIYTLVLVRYNQSINTMPQDVAEANYSLTGLMTDPDRCQATNVFMNLMLKRLKAHEKMVS